MTRNIIKLLTSVLFTLSLTFATAQPGGGGRGGQQPMEDYSQYARYSDQAREKIEPIYIMERYSSYAFVSYDATMLDLRHLNNDISLFMNGVSAGYIGQLHLCKKFPLFMDLGITASYSACDTSTSVSNYLYPTDEWDVIENRRDYDVNLKRLSFSVPMNYGFWMNWNEDVAICPYGGVTMQVNIFADSDSTSQVFEVRTDEDGVVTTENQDDVFELEGNLVNKDEYDENAWNRVQLGWQIGIRTDIKRKYMIGLEYGADIIDVNEKSSGSRFSLKVGMAF